MPTSVGGVNVAMMGTGGSNQDAMQMSGKNARGAEPDLGRPRGAYLTANSMANRVHFTQPSNDWELGADDRQTRNQLDLSNVPNLPSHYNTNPGTMPVAYDGPSHAKDERMIREALRSAANNAESTGSGVVIADSITDKDVEYVKQMRDMAELAKFDDYVESFIDPRKPGNMKWLMEVYPDYITRRLQQAHTDYEFALRNQMIDCWGINTFDDLHFKYLVDQGQLDGPILKQMRPAIDSTYTPGFMSFLNMQPKKGSRMALPFDSARYGAMPDTRGDWSVNRQAARRPLAYGNNEAELANAVFPQRGEGPAARQTGSQFSLNPLGGMFRNAAGGLSDGLLPGNRPGRNPLGR